MARIRTIKPEFWTSEQIVGVSPMARLLFIGLWNFSDDAGIHPHRAMRIKMEVFPGDAFSVDQINEWIEELLNTGLDHEPPLLENYEVDGRKFLRITGFADHQKIVNPSERYPKPPAKNGPGTALSENREAAPSPNPTVNESREDAPSPNPTLYEESPSPNIALPPGREGKGREGKGDLKARALADGHEKLEESFGKFWTACHVKKAKARCRKEFAAAVQAIESEGRQDAVGYLIQQMRVFARSPEAHPDGREPIHPARWLAEARYDDDPASWGIRPRLPQKLSAEDAAQLTRAKLFRALSEKGVPREQIEAELKRRGYD